MRADEFRLRSRWILRVMEWDDARARYPNVWHQGMPRRVLAFETVGGRLRLGDSIAIYYPASERHPERSERFLGLSRVVGLSRADDPVHVWIDLETAHRLERPLDLGRSPRRVFTCCDPGWPGPDTGLFAAVFEAAVAEGWVPGPEESAPERSSAPAQGSSPARPAEAAPEPALASAAPSGPPPRWFAGVDYSGDMRDPRTATWLGVLELRGERLEVVRLDPTGRHGLESCLRDPDRMLRSAEAIGLDFPFSVPVPFAESLLGGSFPDEGWWALARRLEKLSRPDYLVAVHKFREEQGEVKRLTDERATAHSPLHRANPDLGPMTYHGIRMIAEDRSRYAIRPFESAQGRLLLEVYPSALRRKLVPSLRPNGPEGRPGELLAALAALARWPIDVGGPFRERCLKSPDALDAAIAARCAAVAILTGEADRAPDDLVPGQGERLRREGWIYGLEDPQ